MGLEDKKQPFSREYRKIIKEHPGTILPKALKADYKYSDSSLQGYGDEGAFEDSFKPVLPQGERNLRSYIEETLAQREGQAIGIEFGGPGANFFSGFSKGFFRKTAGIDIVGRRGIRETFFRGLGEMIRGHTVIPGDILMPETYTIVRKWLDGNKPDLIVERMLAGFDLNPVHPEVVFKTFERWYELLNENGLMLVQVPWDANTILEPWVAMVKRDYVGLLEVSHYSGDGHDGSAEDVNVLRLRKLPGAPAKLPQLKS